jgi:hypothetical protein
MAEYTNSIERRYHMLKISRSAVAVLALCAFLAGMTGCKKEGPAERAGKEIDKTSKKVEKNIEKAGEKMKDAINDMKK